MFCRSKHVKIEYNLSLFLTILNHIIQVFIGDYSKKFETKT
jgi:hypothetical protein